MATPPPPRSWEPDPSARARAESLAQYIDIDIHITRYILRCRERERRPSSGEWLRWLLDDEQQARIEDKRASRSKEPTDDETGTPMSWRKSRG